MARKREKGWNRVKKKTENGRTLDGPRQKLDFNICI